MCGRFAAGSISPGLSLTGWPDLSFANRSMNSSPFHPCLDRHALPLLALLPFTVLVLGSTINADAANAAVAQVECITPDGRILPLMNGESNPAAALKNDGTIHCPLREGETVFIIALPTASALGHLQFINENAAASGELKIAVSNSRLPADSPAWKTVDGTISFARKRLFDLSMLGVDARYVRLSFRVEKSGTINGISIDLRALQQAASLAAK
jgi:hypothetical protein